MTLRTLIVDDEPPARQRLRVLLQDEVGIEVVGEAEDGPRAVEAVHELRPDLLLLDVQMPGADGFEVLDDLSRSFEGAVPAVVFVTAHDQYALQAFDAHAVDYLLKPFDRSRLRAALDRAHRLADGRAASALAALVAETAGRRPLRRLVVRSRGRIHFVRVEEIDWIQAADHYVALHTAGEEHLVRDTISGLARRLDEDRFVRIHRGTIVNVDRIRELVPLFHGEYEVVLDNGARLRASRTYASALVDRE